MRSESWSDPVTKRGPDGAKFDLDRAEVLRAAVEQSPVVRAAHGSGGAGGVLLAAVPALPLPVLAGVDDPREPGLGPGVGLVFAKLIPRNVVEEAQHGRRLLNGCGSVKDLLHRISVGGHGLGRGTPGELLGLQRSTSAYGFNCGHDTPPRYCR